MRKSSRMPLFYFEEGLIPSIIPTMKYSMDYKKYLDLQTRLEWFYDFHPSFFDDISSNQKKLLQETFLYDTSDEDYPKSIREFYDKKICDDKNLHKEMILAIDALYQAAGAGGFFDYNDSENSL